MGFKNSTKKSLLLHVLDMMEAYQQGESSIEVGKKFACTPSLFRARVCKMQYLLSFFYLDRDVAGKINCKAPNLADRHPEWLVAISAARKELEQIPEDDAMYELNLKHGQLYTVNKHLERMKLQEKAALRQLSGDE